MLTYRDGVEVVGIVDRVHLDTPALVEEAIVLRLARQL